MYLKVFCCLMLLANLVAASDDDCRAVTEFVLTGQLLRSWGHNESTVEIIVHNRTIRRIEPDFLVNFTRLDTFRIMNAKIRDIRQRAFASRPSLTRLSIENSSLSNDQLVDAYFEGLDTLNYLEMPSNGLKTLGYRCFAPLTALRWLDLSDNRLESIENSTFANLSNLKYLYLQKNLIKRIEAQAFMGLNMLLLIMQSNEIEMVASQAFDNFCSKVIEMENNAIDDYIIYVDNGTCLTIEFDIEVDENDYYSAVGFQLTLDP